MTEVEKLILEVESTGIAKTNTELTSLDSNAQKAQASMSKVGTTFDHAFDRAKVKINDYAADLRRVSEATKQAFDAKIQPFSGNVPFGPGSDKGKKEAQSAVDGANALQEKRDVAFRQQIAAIEAASAAQRAADNADLAAQAEINAAEEQRNAIISQRTAIRELQLASTEAEAAQEFEKSAELTRELKIRQASLSLQQGTVISEEESLILAERAVAAEELILATKRAQAALDAEQIAAAEVKLALEKSQAAASTSKIHGRGGVLSSDLQNFGVSENIAKSIGIATIGAFALDGVIERVGKHLDEQRITVEKETHEFEKQSTEWGHMASMATSMTDSLKLHESINQRIEDMRAKQAEKPMIQGTGQTLLDGARMWGNKLSDALSGGRGVDSPFGKTSFDKDEEHAQQQIRTYEQLGKKIAEQADKRAKDFKDIGSRSTEEQVDRLIEKNAKLASKQKAAEPYSKAWIDYQNQIEQVTEALKKAQSAREQFANESTRLKDDFKGAQMSGADKQDKGAEAQARIDELRGTLDELIGSSVPDAAAAFDAASGMVDKDRVAVEKLSIEWQKMQNVIHEELTKNGEALEKNMAKESEHFKKHEEAVANMQGQTNVINAQISGNEALAKRYEMQRDYANEIASLRKAGILDVQSEAAAHDLLNAKLAKQRDDQAKIVGLEEAHNNVEESKLHRSKTNIIDAQVTEERLKKFEALTDKGLNPEQARKIADDAGDALNRKLRKEQHIIGGTGQTAKSSSANDSGFDKAFGPNPNSIFNTGPAGADFFKPKQPDSTEKGVGTDVIKGPGVDVNDGASNLQDAANGLSAAAQALSATAGSVGQLTASINQLSSGFDSFKTQMANLASSVSQLQTDSVG